MTVTSADKPYLSTASQLESHLTPISLSTMAYRKLRFAFNASAFKISVFLFYAPSHHFLSFTLGSLSSLCPILISPGSTHTTISIALYACSSGSCQPHAVLSIWNIIISFNLINTYSPLDAMSSIASLKDTFSDLPLYVKPPCITCMIILVMSASSLSCKFQNRQRLPCVDSHGIHSMPLNVWYSTCSINIYQTG